MFFCMLYFYFLHIYLHFDSLLLETSVDIMHTQNIVITVALDYFAVLLARSNNGP